MWRRPAPRLVCAAEISGFANNRRPTTNHQPPTTQDTSPGINTKSLPGGASPGRPLVILGPCEVSSRRRLMFLFLLRSLFLGCHEVFSSVNFFPCKVVF